MRALLGFLLGIIVGGVTVLYLPAARRDELNRDLRRQVDVLQDQVKNLSEQLKSVNLPKVGGGGSASPTASPR